MRYIKYFKDISSKKKLFAFNSFKSFSPSQMKIGFFFLLVAIIWILTIKIQTSSKRFCNFFSQRFKYKQLFCFSCILLTILLEKLLHFIAFNFYFFSNFAYSHIFLFERCSKNASETNISNWKYFYINICSTLN